MIVKKKNRLKVGRIHISKTDRRNKCKILARKFNSGHITEIEMDSIKIDVYQVTVQ